jgi:hypothetical protein
MLTADGTRIAPTAARRMPDDARGPEGPSQPAISVTLVFKRT